ncbi:Delta-aminolevulinic acid dehydratase [Chlamydiales bacterium STE3]|nr:Delta-aminolevulinic acid dehydratase [Chlamydiales bacterium STE3]
MDTIDTSLDLLKRPRRNRRTASIRSLVRETHLLPEQLIAPLFIIEGTQIQQEISSLPEVCRLSIDLLVKEVIHLYELGIRAVDLFPVIHPEQKSRMGCEALNEEGLLARALRTLKKEIPEMCLMVDVALDPYTDHGHDGLINSEGIILNDETIAVLAKMSVLAAENGADIVAPSDMMDGRVASIRQALDQQGFQQVGILSYAAKYASALYGPFREALGSAPKFGDKKSYQMDPSNVREALRECALDEEEGADMLLIKPALAYLDVLSKVREQSNLPLGAYHVSGEYAMVKAAALNGWIDGKRVMMEHLLAIRRAGADFILTYAAAEIAAQL